MKINIYCLVGFVLLLQNINTKLVLADFDENKEFFLYQVNESNEQNNNFALPLKMSHSSSDEVHEEINAFQFWSYIFIIAFLTCFAGLMSGLTVGYLSIDDLVLELKTTTGDDKEKEYASKVLPILANRHWLLVTLLLSNAFAMEALPLYLDKVVPEYLAIIISVSLVLIFGEVLPQAYCTGPDQVKIAAGVAPYVRFLMLALSPICYPIAKLLDKILGEHHKSRFVNTDLKALIELHTYNALKKMNIIEDEHDKNNNNNHGNMHGGNHDSYNSKHNPNNQLGLLDEQANLMISAIDMKDKKTVDLMIPIKNVFMIDYDDPLDKFKLNLILDKGYSRIPVYANHNKNDIVGLLRMKKLIGVDTNQNKSLRQLGIPLSRPIVIAPNLSLLDLLREFRKGMSHMAFITDQVEDLQSKLESTTASSSANISRKESIKLNKINQIKILGIITLEDVLEKMINLEILDEDDYNHMIKRTKISSNTKMNKLVCQELTKSFILHESMKINSLLKDSYNLKNTFNENFLNSSKHYGDSIEMKNKLKDPLI